MRLEDQVCSSELGKKLDSLGIKQDSNFCWVRPWKKDRYEEDQELELILTERYRLNGRNGISAPTVAELGEMLPEKVNGFSLWFQKYDGMFYVAYYEDAHTDCAETRFDTFLEKNEADARAKMLIHLIERGLVKTEKE